MLRVIVSHVCMWSSSDAHINFMLMLFVPPLLFKRGGNHSDFTAILFVENSSHVYMWSSADAHINFMLMFFRATLLTMSRVVTIVTILQFILIKNASSCPSDTH
jgi:hypothetical protein